MCSVTEWVHVWECMEWDGGFGAWDEWCECIRACIYNDVHKSCMPIV